MADYTVVRVSDVPDRGPKLAGTDKLELRFLRDDLGCERCGVSYLRYGAGWTHPLAIATSSRSRSTSSSRAERRSSWTTR